MSVTHQASSREPIDDGAIKVSKCTVKQTKIAVAFLVDHELGHQYLGHLDNVAKGSVKQDCHNGELSRGWKIEYEADAFGVDFALM